MKVSRMTGKKIPKMICQRLKDVSQNYLLAQFYDSYGDIMIFAGLEFRTASWTSTLSVLSFFVAIIYILLGAVMLYVHVKLLKRYQELKREGNIDDNKSYHKLEQFKTRHKGFKTLFSDFKDVSFAHQAFLLFFILRSVVAGITLAFLFKYPLAQIIIFNLSSVILLAYIIILKPFEKGVDFIQQITFEIAIFIVNISLLVAAVLDT